MSANVPSGLASRVASHHARAAILQKLRAAPVTPSDNPPDVAGYFRERPTPDALTRTQRFIDAARGWRAEVIETDATHWPSALTQVLQAHDVQTLMAGRNTVIADTLSTTAPAQLRWYDEDLSQCKNTLFNDIDASITTTIAGVAETGSMLLHPTRDEPRTLSLIPPLHIAILHERELRETLIDAVRETQDMNVLPTNLVLVTGPSKTADIQRLLVYGAHGPKALVILLLRDAPSEIQR